MFRAASKFFSKRVRANNNPESELSGGTSGFCPWFKASGGYLTNHNLLIKY
jgi:hypothetical protein